MAFVVARGAAEDDFFDDCVARLCERRVVVVVEELCASTVDAVVVACFDHALLAGGWVALAA